MAMDTKIKICSAFTSGSTDSISFICVISSCKSVKLGKRASHSAVSGKPSQPSGDAEDSEDDKSIDLRSGQSDWSLDKSTFAVISIEPIAGHKSLIS